MKKLVLAVLIAFSGYAMEYEGPVERGEETRVKERIPQVAIGTIENKSPYNIIINLDGKPVTNVIKAGETKPVRIKVPMRSFKYSGSTYMRYEKNKLISVVGEGGKTYIQDIEIWITHYPDKYNVLINYDLIQDYYKALEENFPNGTKFYDFHIILIFKGNSLINSTAEVIAVE